MSCCKKVKDGSKPDLIFYYDINNRQQTTTYKDDDIETIVFRNIYYLDKELTIPIANYLSNVLYAKNKKDQVGVVTITFDNYNTDLKGGFQCVETSIIPIILNTYNPNNTIIFDIYAGSGSFLGVEGFSVLITDDTSLRQVFVYFAK